MRKGSSVAERRDGVAGMEDAALKDLGAESAAMAETLLDALHSQGFQMAARLAQPDAAQDDVADLEAPSHEMIERHVARQQVSPCLVGPQAQLVLTDQAVERFTFDERDL